MIMQPLPCATLDCYKWIRFPILLYIRAVATDLLSFLQYWCKMSKPENPMDAMERGDINDHNESQPCSTYRLPSVAITSSHLSKVHVESKSGKLCFPGREVDWKWKEKERRKISPERWRTRKRFSRVMNMWSRLRGTAKAQDSSIKFRSSASLQSTSAHGFLSDES